MVEQADFLVEIQTAELPPKSLLRLAKAFLHEIEERLKKAEFPFSESHFYATPRRLAVLIKNVTAKQADSFVERKGPALEAAFDPQGQPTQACLGFARSCGVTPDQLQIIKNDSGAWVGFQQTVKGKFATELLPSFVQQALAALPIPKRMRWGNYSVEFVRPVYSVMMLYGEDVIAADILGCRSDRKTRGHRFMSPGWIEIKKPSDYAAALEKVYVIADFEKRKERIRKQALQLSPHAHITDSLLDEVTGLVEWPVAISGTFSEDFLTVPQEALISAMQDHQRYFPIMDEKGKLQSRFITISNIESKNVQQVIAGNERVLRARLSDAAFFFETDKKQTLESRIERLKTITFQAKLGSVYDKTLRIAKLARYIANELGEDAALSERAARLSKTDLTTELVGEFPELQGIAGYYYALHDGETESVAKALNEQYMPRFSGDKLPTTTLGFALAIADRIDTLIGVFGINQQPTGDKDPFGLRRAALGVLRILIEKKLNLDLHTLLEIASASYTISLENSNVVTDVLHFMLERLKPWYQEQGISPDVFSSVAALQITIPYDIHCRVQAVQLFKKMPEAESLSVANKRVSNILAKYEEKISANHVDEKLFDNDAERELLNKIQEQQESVIALSKSAQYQTVLTQLASLRTPVDSFFDTVLVMTDDKARRENRLLLLKKLRELFLYVADIALLQS